MGQNWVVRPQNEQAISGASDVISSAKEGSHWSLLSAAKEIQSLLGDSKYNLNHGQVLQPLSLE